MMKNMMRFPTLLVLLLAAVTTVSAQRNNNDRSQQPYSDVYRYDSHVAESRSFGLFFAEYNRMTMHSDKVGTSDANFNGVSVGFDYFMPMLGRLGLSAGGKLQYFFRNETVMLTRFKDNLLSATVPVNVMYDWRISDGLAIDPYAGVFGRYNLSAKQVWEEDGMPGRTSVNLFDDDQAKYYGLVQPKRLQMGFQVGVNVRISEMMTIGGVWWTDISEYAPDTKLHGFNITLGANF